MSRKSEKSGAPFNPFKDQNPDEVWQKILNDTVSHSSKRDDTVSSATKAQPPLSREEVMRRLQEQAQRAKKH